jgi:hypothetical protein
LRRDFVVEEMKDFRLYVVLDRILVGANLLSVFIDCCTKGERVSSGLRCVTSGNPDSRRDMKDSEFKFLVFLNTKVFFGKFGLIKFNLHSIRAWSEIAGWLIL